MDIRPSNWADRRKSLAASSTRQPEEFQLLERFSLRANWREDRPVPVSINSYSGFRTVGDCYVQAPDLLTQFDPLTE